METAVVVVTQTRKMGRPRMGDPVNVRLPDDLHDAACRKALARGLCLSDVIREAVRLYVSRSVVQK